MTLNQTQLMIIMTFVEAAILRALRDMDGLNEEEEQEMLAQQKARNAALIASIKQH